MSRKFNHRMPVAIIAGLIVAVCCTRAESASTEREFQVIQTVPFDYSRLATDSTVPASGEIRVLLLIDDAGRLHDLLVLGAVHPALIAPVAAGIKQWEFVPPTRNGQPIGARATLRIFVDRDQGAAVVSVMEAVAEKLRGHRQLGFESYLASADELDQPVRLIQRTSPVVPAEWTGKPGEAGRVIVDFYIDQTGRPRMPMIDESTDPLLSVAALEALLQWQFEPPRRQNLPVIVRVKQEINFPAQTPAEVPPVDGAR